MHLKLTCVLQFILILLPLTLWAKGYEQYFFLNGADWQYNYKALREEFGPQRDQRVKVGQAAMFYIFERPLERLEQELREHLRQAETYEIPILVELDPVTFTNNVPELWNWWDKSYDSYHPDNKKNVEWTSWSSDDAVCIGWLNWGRQMRIQPMMNLFSKAYRAAVKERMNALLGIVTDWYGKLETEKRWLFCGVKVTGELAFGVNNWFFPDGNALLHESEEYDPVLDMGESMKIMPSRGAQTIGYASLATSGIRRKGDITAQDIYRLERRFSKEIGRLARRAGLPRRLLFAHAGGVGEDLGSCLHSYACPAWSFYHHDAHFPAEAEAMKYLSRSDAPYFGVAEFSLWEEPDPERWAAALLRAYAIERCRYVALFTSTGDFLPESGAKQGIRQMQQKMNNIND